MGFLLQCFGNFETPSQETSLIKAAETGWPLGGRPV